MFLDVAKDSEHIAKTLLRTPEEGREKSRQQII